MENETGNTTNVAFMQRDALMTLLIAQAQGLIQQLALLAGTEKAAVAGLVSIGQAMVAYARAAQPDPEVMAGFDRVLTALSPALAGRIARPCSHQACLEESRAHAGALATCLRAGKGHAQCERETLAEATAETACITRNLKELLAALAPSADESQRKAGTTRSLPSHR